MIKSFVYAAVIGVVVFACTLAVETYMLNAEKGDLPMNLEGNLLNAGAMVPTSDEEKTTAFLSDKGELIIVSDEELGGVALASDGEIIQLQK